MFEVLFVVLGLVFGSFGSVLVTRLPEQKGIGGRSVCPACGMQLRMRDMMPIVSYMFLHGKCRACRNRISLLYPALELTSALLFLYATMRHGDIYVSLLLALSLWLLLIISIIDWRTQLISDALNLPFLFLGVLYTMYTGVFSWTGIAVGVAFFGLLWLVSKGRWVGSGDVLLAAGIGAFVGDWKAMLICLFVTYVLGAVVVSFMMLARIVRRGDHVAFAPFLALGAACTVIFSARVQLLIDLYF